MNKQEEIRVAAEADLVTFINLVHPQRVLGALHKDLCAWWTRQEAINHQLVLLPRDHCKSAMIAYRAAWYIVKYPDIRILYVSSTSNLAEKQLKFIKDILAGDTVRRFWPDLVNKEEGKRAKWSSTEIEVDHPLRKAEAVRDPTVFAAGLTTGITGLHFDVAILDDVVVYENAYTNEGRNKVRSQYSLLASIESADSEEWVVGTRYHLKDLYSDMMTMTQEEYTDDGEIIGESNIYEKYERTVESRGDGTGEFLWPRQQRQDGKWFGFNRRILAQKRGKYLDRTQFHAQYYNNPNNPEGNGIDTDKFQYYDRKFLTRRNGLWYYRDNRLNVYAAIDFAYSMSRSSDYSAIVVVGVDKNGCIFVLDVDRFQTDKISEYFKHVMNMHIKWDFRKLRAETTAAQKAIVRELKDSYIRPNGLSLSVDEHSPNRHMGSKVERMRAVLEPRYDNLTIFHYVGGHCQTLEEELILENPPHDDLKDALAAAIEICVPPRGHQNGISSGSNILTHSRFGGVSF